MYYDYFDTGLIGTLTLMGDEEGLRAIAFPQSRHPRPIAPDWPHYPEFFTEVKHQLTSYFQGELKTFHLTLAPEGTAFQRQVWEALTHIPYGAVASYKDIAQAIGNPKAVRAVGGANARNPIPIIVPCHRVIGSNGALTGFGGGLDTKSRLLELEQRQS